MLRLHRNPSFIKQKVPNELELSTNDIDSPYEEGKHLLTGMSAPPKLNRSNSMPSRSAGGDYEYGSFDIESKLKL